MISKYISLKAFEKDIDVELSMMVYEKNNCISHTYNSCEHYSFCKPI